ncbi:MAG TPA: hypothetical protein VHH73_04610, partial [Verrucomicrobiae bacterium]|nr:hypothetical protein [Verrucomicrobiae bacterium]
MRLPPQSPKRSERGIAMIIVMLTIIVLAVLAGGFAYSMKVETRLAKNTSLDTDLEWLGRSGVELARYVLSQSMTLDLSDNLRQKWAGGTGNTNDVLADISLVDNRVGEGMFSIKIVDAERKLNINRVDGPMLQQALTMVGCDPAEFSMVSDSILDWIDRDDKARLAGAENEYYLSLKPPYVAKNGPMGDISELLLVRGMTPAIYWGPASNNAAQPTRRSTQLGLLRQPGSSFGSVGMVDLFTALSSGQVNPNTAGQPVLELMLGSAQAASEAIRHRAGYDGVEGDDDDTPFTSPAEVAAMMQIPQGGGGIPGAPGGGPAANFTSLFTTRSMTFEVQVDARIAGYRRKFIALLRRQ